MISLLFTMLRTRWRTAVTVALLAAFATAAAAAGPAYLDAVDRGVVHREVATATPAERSVSMSATVQPGSLATGSRGPDVSQIAIALIRMPGFSAVLAIDLEVLGLEKGGKTPTQLSYRQDACAHLTVVTGRCVMGVGDIVVGVNTAGRLGLHAGQTVTLVYGEVDQTTHQWKPVGTPITLTIAGTYRPVDPDGLYWGGHGYFAADGTGTPAEPIFASQATVQAIDHRSEQDTVDVLGGDAAFTPARIGGLRGEVQDIAMRSDSIGQGAQTSTAIPQLLDRIDRGRRLAGQVVPVAAVPLVLLAWFVIFLAVGYATQERRTELGLFALRGLRLPGRLLLAGGEYLVPIVLGGVLGAPLGLLVVQVLARARLGDVGGPATGTGTALGYAALAGAGALVAAFLAQRRELFAPVADLLRRVTGGARRWRGPALDAVAVALAVAAAAQIRVFGGDLTGIGALAPALVMIAVAVLAARAVVPLAARYGARSLARGRTGIALATLQLGRRPGAHRVFALLVVAIALLGFATTGFDVAAQARADRARIVTGAPRVLSVNPVTRLKLLQATRAADPDGRWAMAVSELPVGEQGAVGEPAKLAVDTSRLAAVATWRADYGGPGPARLAAALHPAARAPIVVRGTTVALDLTVDPTMQFADLGLAVTLISLSGDAPMEVPLGVLVPGKQTRSGDAGGCAQGCRLVGFLLTRSGSGGYQVPMTLHELRTDQGVTISASQLADLGRWRATAPQSATLSSDPSGLHIAIHSANGVRADGSIQPADTPDPLPVASTRDLPAGTTLAGFDGVPTRVTEVARLHGVPGLGADGVLVDLEYADRVSSEAGAANNPEVWLGPAAPPDAAQRLHAQGLVIIGDTRVGAVRAALDGQGPALALWFHLLVAGFAVLLAAGGVRLVAGVDRGRRAADLRALRVQGLPARVTGRAGLTAYLLVVVTAVPVGLLAAAVAWWVAGGDLPVFVDGAGLWPAPHWPRPLAVLWPWLAAAAILVGVALVAGRDLRRAVRRAEPDEGAP